MLAQIETGSTSPGTIVGIWPTISPKLAVFADRRLRHHPESVLDSAAGLPCAAAGFSNVTQWVSIKKIKNSNIKNQKQITIIDCP